MYINVEPDPEKPPKWRSKRGTSALEGFHRHWHTLLPGFNTSVELADTLMMLFLGRWNRKKSFQYGAAFYGTFNYQARWRRWRPVWARASASSWTV